MGELALEHLSEDDIRILVRHPDPEKRATAAQRICRTVRTSSLSDSETRLAADLLKFMAKDAVEMVRRALAVTLRNSQELPRSVALQLIADVDNIALPIIEFSPVLTDDDLIEVLKSDAAAKIMAVARRPLVSGNLVKAIVRYGDSKAVATVAANDGALIDAETAEDILDFYYHDDLIREAMISRADLPNQVMEKLITMVSEEAAAVLKEKHKIAAATAVNLANQSRERASLELISDDDSDKEIREFSLHMAQMGRLTPSFIIRAIGLGRMSVVKHSLAVLAEISPNKAGLMMFDTGPFGLSSLCKQADLSDYNTRIVKAGCAIYRDLEISGIEYDAEYFQTLMLERTLTLPFELPEPDREWLMERLDAKDRKAA